jgi:hypothetical protein
MNRLIALYPAAWRARYGDEFGALLASRPRSPREWVDIVVGAADAHLHPQVSPPSRVRDWFGIAPLIGLGFLALAVELMASGPVHYDEYGTYRDGAAALPFLVLAFVLLSIGLFRIVDRLPGDASGSRFAGWTAIVVGPVWAFMPWVLPLALAFIVGLLGLAVGARRAGLLPAWSEVLLVALLAIPAGLMTAMLFLPWYAVRVAELNYLVILGPLAAPWLIVGLLLLRGYPEPTPADR